MTGRTVAEVGEVRDVVECNMGRGVTGPCPMYSLMSTQTPHASSGVFRSGGLFGIYCIITPRVEPLHFEALRPWKGAVAMPTP